MKSPFIHPTSLPIVAIRGRRNGYLQIAPSAEVTSYAELPDAVLMAAKAWASHLESMGSERVYWIILSEQVRHLHIHVYPRWSEDTQRGVALFEAREHSEQPRWTPRMQQACHSWAENHGVYLL